VTIWPDTGTVTVYPNPFRPGSGTGKLKFHGFRPGDSVEIYTVRGLRVWQAKASGALVEWDGRNEAGNKVAPGSYLWVAEGPGGKRRGTLVVE